MRHVRWMRCAPALLLLSMACLGRAQNPDQRAAALVSRMTLDEKIDQLHGVTNKAHDRWVPGVPRLGIPPLPMANGPAGIGPADLVQPLATAFPSPLAVAASWDRGEAHAYGAAVADEIGAIGRTMLEAPTVNIARVPQSGRVFEGYGEDPFLTSALGVANIRGIQSQSILANVKHFALNNQETNRLYVDAHADERTKREIYFPAFEAAVKQAHVASLMCSYNKVDGQYACRNKALLTDVLRNEWGFDGFVISDFGAAHDGVADALAGMDLEMPTPDTYNDAFKAQVRAGKVPMAQIDTLLRRRYRTMIRFGLFDKPITTRPLPEKANAKIARRLAGDGMVLLKNAHGVLPLADDDGSIAVIGPAADTLLEGGGAASVLPLHTVVPIAALRTRFGKERIRYAPVGGVGFIDPRETLDGLALSPPGAAAGEHGGRAEYFANTDLAGKPAVVRTERVPQVFSEFGAPVHGLDGHFSMRWSADLQVPADGTYTLGVESWGRTRLLLDGKPVIESGKRDAALQPTASVQLSLRAHRRYRLCMEYVSHGRGLARVFWQLPEGVHSAGFDAAVAAARQAKTAVVFAGVWSHEGFDRPTLALSAAQNALIEAIAAANPNTVVVLQSGTPVTMPWLDEVAGVVEAWFPGEEGGPAMADILSGDRNPSGRLPLTFPASDTQLPASTPDQYPGIDKVQHYNEGLEVGYRWYDARRQKPLFPFGFGLSYTHFDFSELAAKPQSDGSVAVDVTVTNDGSRAGDAVTQLYVGYPQAAKEPPLQLREFDKSPLEPGQSRRLHFVLPPRAFSYWSVAKHGWVIAPGGYTIAVGDSSRDLPLRTTLKR